MADPEAAAAALAAALDDPAAAGDRQPPAALRAAADALDTAADPPRGPTASRGWRRRRARHCFAPRPLPTTARWRPRCVGGVPLQREARQPARPCGRRACPTRRCCLPTARRRPRRPSQPSHSCLARRRGRGRRRPAARRGRGGRRAAFAARPRRAQPAPRVGRGRDSGARRLGHADRNWGGVAGRAGRGRRAADVAAAVGGLPLPPAAAARLLPSVLGRTR